MCPEGTFCGHPVDFSILLEDDGVYDRPSINYAIATFDNIFKALFTIF
jgi:hypothetical protein